MAGDDLAFPFRAMIRVQNCRYTRALFTSILLENLLQIISFLLLFNAIVQV